MTTAVDWTQTYRDRAARSATRAQVQGIAVRTLDTTTGGVVPHDGSLGAPRGAVTAA